MFSCKEENEETLENVFNYYEEEILIRIESLKIEIDKLEEYKIKEIDKLQRVLNKKIKSKNVFTANDLKCDTIKFTSTKKTVLLKNLFKNLFNKILIDIKCVNISFKPQIGKLSTSEFC